MWVDTTGDDSLKQCPVFQPQLAAHRHEADTCRYLVRDHLSSTGYIDIWPRRTSSMYRSNHVMGCQSDDNTSPGQSLLIDGPAGCEHANAVGEGKKAFHCLQLEIRSSNDRSIFVWDNQKWGFAASSLLYELDAC